MKLLLLALFLPATALAGVANETVSSHTVRVYEDNGTAASLKFLHVLDNGDGEPGIYIVGDHDGKIVDDFAPYNPQLTWSRKPEQKQIDKTETKIRSVLADHPHRILMDNNLGEDGAKALLLFLEQAKDSYELSYKDAKNYNRLFTQKVRTPGGGLGHFTEIEKVVPASEITITNKKTGKEDKLDDFVAYLLQVKDGGHSAFVANLNQVIDSFNEKGTLGKTVAGKDSAVLGLRTPKVVDPWKTDPWHYSKNVEVPNDDWHYSGK